MNAIALQNASADYSSRWWASRRPALLDLTLQVGPGECVGVIGRSGSGKTTLARVLTGTIRPRTGRLDLLGQDTASWSRRQWLEARRNIQLLPQRPSVLLPPRVPLQLTMLESAILHRPDESAPSVVADVLTDLGLTEHAWSTPEMLSGGQLRRASIARVLLARPTILVADEPTAGLDGALALRLLGLLHSRLAPTCAQILISHDVRVLSRCCSRLLVIDGGMNVESIDTSNLRPQTAVATALFEAAGMACSS